VPEGSADKRARARQKYRHKLINNSNRELPAANGGQFVYIGWFSFKF
jgi:hypothetical protein